MHPTEILRALLARQDFRRILRTRLFSQCADGVFQASLAGAVLFNPERQTDPAQIAAGFAVLLLPYSFVGPFAGVLLDRWSRQRVLVMSNLVRCAIVAVVAAEIAAGWSGPLFYASALAATSVNRFFLAALSASLPHVVTPVQIVTATSLTTTCGTVIAALGGALALGVRELTGSDNHGYAVVALCSALGYAGSALAARRFGKAQLGPDDVELSHRETAGDVLRGLVAGARHVAARKPVLYGLAAISAHRFFYGVSTIATLLLYRNYFTDDGVLRSGLTGLGQAFGASAVGILVSAVVTPPVTRRIGKPVWFTWVLAAACVTQLLLGVPYTMQALLPAALVLGFAAQAAKICVDTTVQEQVEDEFRGRVFSVYDTLFNVTFVAAAVAAAMTLPDTGKSYVVLAAVSVGYGATALCYAAANRRLVSRDSARGAQIRCPGGCTTRRRPQPLPGSTGKADNAAGRRLGSGDE